MSQKGLPSGGKDGRPGATHVQSMARMNCRGSVTRLPPGATSAQGWADAAASR